MRNWQKNLFSLSGLAVMAVLLVGLIVLSNILLRGFRLDLTENRLYTVSEGTRNVLRKIDEPINVYFFYSETEARTVPSLRPYAVRVRETLEEFAQHADDKLRLQVIDPLPFSEEEDQASQFGLQALPTASGASVYMGLAATNSVGDQETIPFFDPGKEATLEYDLAKLVYTLANPKKPVVGLMTGLSMGGDFNPQTRQVDPAWVIDEQINSLFELRDLSPGTSVIDDEIDVLMLVHPKNLSDETLYGIDQFIMRGGKALIFVDPHAEVDRPVEDPNNPAAAFAASRSSSLERLFDGWGIAVSTASVLGDNVLALQISARPGAPPARHLALLGLTAEQFNQEDVVTGDLTSVNLGMPGYIETKEDAAVAVIPLMQSTDEAGTIPVDRVRFLSDPNALRDVFAPTGNKYTLAARISGQVASAFPDGAPGDGDTEGHLAVAEDSINVVVVADVDMLADQFWVQVRSFFGQRIVTAWSGNGDFVVNTLDNLTGSSDLIGIRSRETYRRPFERVEELKRKADERFLAKEQELQDQLTATEDKLSQLQSGRDEGNALIMTAEQSAEIQRFLDQRVGVRKELRRVRRDLDRDIKKLGTTLKVINIGLIPSLIIIGAIVATILRSRRRKSGVA
ncbi:MAG: Gldg family protein [Gammaproteobacteria bacterium]|nr:Gldg family protein [Gammaproteobacteria bacterium]